MHSKEHDAWNKLGEQLGFPTNEIDNHVGKVLKTVQRFFPKPLQLAATVCLEHYTAIMAEQLLRDEMHQTMGDPETMKLWLWHALEENEHKTVAYDVYETVNGSYLLRTGAMIPVTAIFFGLVAYYQVKMLRADKQLSNWKGNLKGMSYLFGRRGLFTRLVPQYLDYFKPGFHPADHDTDALLEEWREKLFGADGLLTEQHQKASQRKGRKKSH